MSLAEFFDAVNDWWGASAYEVYGNSLARWAAVVAAFLLLLLVLKLIKMLAARRVEALAATTATKWDDAAVDALKATRLWFLLLMSAYLATLPVVLPATAREAIDKVAIIALLLQAAIWGTVLLTSGFARYIEQRRETDAETATTVSAVSFLAKLVLWSVVALLVLANLGVDITALVAGLGIGGVAVALAAQNILADLFASLSIVLDKPFVLGDFIIVGDQMGTVEKIGLKTTRLRSLSGEQLIFSNTDLLKSRIRNFKRMYQRRALFTIGVTYDTPREKLEEIPKMIREIVEGAPSTRFDRSHFKEFGDSALVFETVYFVLSSDYNLYMDIQQAINLAIYQRFDERQIKFAFPTRTLWINQKETA
jgi:small-conductance mechanosensitive channel